MNTENQALRDALTRAFHAHAIAARDAAAAAHVAAKTAATVQALADALHDKPAAKKANAVRVRAVRATINARTAAAVAAITANTPHY